MLTQLLVPSAKCREDCKKALLSMENCPTVNLGEKKRILVAYVSHGI